MKSRTTRVHERGFQSKGMAAAWVAAMLLLPALILGMVVLLTTDGGQSRLVGGVLLLGVVIAGMVIALGWPIRGGGFFDRDATAIRVAARALGVRSARPLIWGYRVLAIASILGLLAAWPR